MILSKSIYCSFFDCQSIFSPCIIFLYSIEYLVGGLKHIWWWFTKATHRMDRWVFQLQARSQTSVHIRTPTDQLYLTLSVVRLECCNHCILAFCAFFLMLSPESRDKGWLCGRLCLWISKWGKMTSWLAMWHKHPSARSWIISIISVTEENNLIIHNTAISACAKGSWTAKNNKNAKTGYIWFE